MAKRKTSKIKALKSVKPEEMLSEGLIGYRAAKQRLEQQAQMRRDKLRGKIEVAPLRRKYFEVTRGGKQKDYSVNSGYGYFIPTFQHAENLVQVADLVEKGIPSKEIQPIVKFLEFKVSEIAKAAAVSASTVSRWAPTTSIGVPGSSQFFKIDELIRKGVDLFGGLEEFKSWLDTPNTALGNVVPAKLISSLIGVELIDEALDALNYGNVL